MEQSPTRALAQFIVNSRPEDLPSSVRHESKRALLHWLACSVGGSRHPSVLSALSALDEFSGKRECALLGRAERVDALLAALINGISADALGFTDTHLKTVIHPGGVIGPAILPLAERMTVPGSEFLHAFSLGMEVACRLGLVVYPWHYERGWHITGTAGVVGAAAAVARLLQLDEKHTVWALGLAVTQAAGLREMFGSMTKSFHMGRAAQGGLVAGLLARHDYTSSEKAIEAPRGFAHVLGENPDLGALTRDLGVTFEIMQNTYKPFPCGIVVHPAADGCITLAKKHDLDAAEIQQVTLRVHPLVLELCGRKSPATPGEAKLSVFHSAAMSLLTRRLTLSEYEPEMVNRADVAELRSRIQVLPDSGIREDEADLQVMLRSGTELHHHVDHAIGSAARPMSDGDIEAKAYGLTEGVLSRSQSEELMNACWSIEHEPRAGILAELGSVRASG